MLEHQMVRLLMSERTQVLAYVQSLVRDLDAAEDIFQDTCVLAIQKSQEIIDAGHLMKWLRTTARFNAMNFLRKRRLMHLTLSSQTLDLLEADWKLAGEEDSADLKESLRRCMAKLSAAMQTLVRQRYVERLDYAKISRQTGRPVNSLYVTFSRIYATLGDCIAEEKRPPEKIHG